MSELFLTFFNTAVTAGWLVLAVLVARLLLKKAPAWAKCALWAIVGLRLMWPFEIESILSLVPSAQTLPPAALYDPAPEIHTGVPYLNSTINPTFTQTFTPEPAASINPLQTAVAVASVVWIIGMVAMASFAAISYLRLRHRVRVSMPAADGVYLCDRISSPFILGLFWPKIYLPSDLPQEKWDAILAHERAHLIRRDHWWKPLGFALLTVFWFHPLLWLAYILLCRDVELACDEKVIRALSPEEKQSYSEILLECSVPKKWITACPLAFGETSVKTRIKAVLHYKKPTLWIIIAALLLCSVLAVCFLTEPHADLTGVVYRVEEQVFRPDMISYDPVLSGHFRVTQEGILQYDYETRYSGTELGWQDVGHLEKMTLTRENFDDVLLKHFTLDDKQPMLEQIRRNNKNAWRVVAAEDPSMWDGIFLEQKNGDFYYLLDDRFLYQLSRRPAIEAPANISNKQYVYEKEGAGSEFYISIYEDGTFQYYEGNYSSHIGLGDWELKEGKLYLYDTTLTNPMTFVFSVHEDALAYIAAESFPFMYVEVADGDIFRYYADLSPTDRPGTAATLLFDRDLPDTALQGEEKLEGFQDVSVRWSLTPNLITSEEMPMLVKDGEESTLFGDYPPPRSLYLADVTGDGRMDLCADVYYFFSGLPSFNTVCVYDIVNDCYYLLADRSIGPHITQVSYCLRLEEGRLLCDKVSALSQSYNILDTGTLYITESGELRLKELESQTGTAVPQAVGHYSEDDDNWSWNFGLTVSQNGRFSYSEGMASSYIGSGNWEMKNGKLYLTEGERCFVFEVRADGLVFIAGESDRGLSLEDGQLLPRSQMDKHLTFVEVTDIQKDHFLAVDAQGNTWRIEHPCYALGFDLEKCWVTYFGQLEIDEEGRYLVRAASCWLYRDGTGDAGTIFDSYIFDVDGDGTAEHCYLTCGLTSSPAYVSRLNTMVYQLIVTKADGTTYNAAFLKLLILDENALGTIISSDLDTAQHRRVYAYEEAFAFAVEEGELVILAPRGGEYIETGVFETYQITLAEDKLIVILR